MIERSGGAKKFYAKYFIAALSPLGFIMDGKNLNYYDDKNLLKKVTPFIADCIEQQLQWNVNRESCICIGGEKNYKFFLSLNEKHRWFNEIIPLPHPRFIMQYRRKQKEKFINDYLRVFNTSK